MINIGKYKLKKYKEAAERFKKAEEQRVAKRKAEAERKKKRKSKDFGNIDDVINQLKADETLRNKVLEEINLESK